MSRWDGIEEFVAVAQHNSFKLAAQSLGRSTSHVSRAVAQLENALNAPLFFRTTRQVTLTDTGRALVEHCQQLVRDRDETYAMLEGNAVPQGELRVTCAVALGERFVAPTLMDFAKGYPKLAVTLDLSNRKRDLVGDGFDLAIRTGDLADSNLTRTMLARRQWKICASADYLKQYPAPQSISDLNHHHCILGTAPSWTLKDGKKSIEFKPQPRFRCNSGTAVLHAALSSMGIVYLPEFYVRQAISDGTLVSLLEDNIGEPEPIWAVYPNRRHLQPKVYMLIEHLKNRLSLDLG